MKKIYYIGPITAFALFTGYAMHFNKSYDARAAEVALEAKTAREARLKAEAEARKKAIDDAVAAQAKLKADRLAKEADELRKKEARQAAIDTRDRNFREQEKIARTLERLKKEIKIEQDAIAKLDGSIKYNKDEKVFIAQFTEKARLNIASLSDLLNKIEAVEIARATPPPKTTKNES
jgi:hypothetical protein